MGEIMPRRASHNQRPRKRQRAQSAAATEKRVSASSPVRTSDDEMQWAPAEVAPVVTRPYQSRPNQPRARSKASSIHTLSKAQEYAFVREDLQRLLLTSGVLLVLMIALLLVIDR